jgi:hypothetical protein
MPRRRADNIRRTQRKNKTLIVNDENGSGGCGGCESASRDRKAHGKIFVKNKKINDSSTNAASRYLWQME